MKQKDLNGLKVIILGVLIALVLFTVTIMMILKEAKELANKVTDENVKKLVINSITEQQNNLIPMTAIRDRLKVITNS